MGPPQGRAEGEENLPRPAAHTPLNAPQDPIGLLGTQGTLLAHGQLVIPGSSLRGSLVSTSHWELNASMARSTKQSTHVTPRGADPAEALTLRSWVGHDRCRGGSAPGVLSGDGYPVAHPWCDPGIAGLGADECC